jgi:membrane protein required for colicin V production
MNSLDLIVILLLAGAVMQGYRMGLVLQAATLASWLAAAWVAWQFTDELAPVIAETWPLPESMKSGWLALLPVDRMIHSGISFVLLFIGTRFLLSIVVSLVNQAANLPLISWFNRSGGVIVSLLKTVLVTGMAVHLLHALPWESGRDAVRDSVIARTVLEMTPGVTDELKELFLGQPL